MSLGLFSPRPRKPFLGLALAAIGGIVLAERWSPEAWPVLGACAAIALLAMLRANAWLCRVLTLLVFFAMHGARQNSPGIAYARTLESGKQTLEATGVVWSEPEPSEGWRGEKIASFWLKLDTLRVDGCQLPMGGCCLAKWLGPAPLYGDRVRLKGTARTLGKESNPGGFDISDWLRRHGVYFALSAERETDCIVTEHGRGNAFQHFAIAARTWVKDKIEITLDDAPDVTALIESMVLGMRGDTPPEMKAMFQKTGTLHLFAVSGLNVAMLAAIAWYLLKPFRVSRAAAFFFILPLLIAYAVATGLGASCVRATVMAGFLLAAPLAGRPAVPLNSIAASALAILAWDTNELFSPGFQLSYVLVLVIMALAGPIAHRVERVAQPDDFLPEPLYSKRQRWGLALWKIFAQTTGVTVAAWLGSLLFMAGYFHLISPVAIVANAIAVPLSFIILSLGLMTLLVAAPLPSLVPVVNAANWACAKLLLAVVALFAKTPGGHLYIETPKLRHAPLCELTALDVGEGAAIHVRTGAGDWLLDAGHARDYSRTVLPYLRSRGVNRLSGLLLTHGDTAHIGGALPLLGDFLPQWIADTGLSDRSPARRALHSALATANHGRRLLTRSDVMDLAPEVRLRVLYPPADIAGNTSDDRALVLLLEAGERRVLLTSDAGFTTEQWLLKNEPTLRADVLIKGWHDKDALATTDLLTRIGARAVVFTSPPINVPTEALTAWHTTLAEQKIESFPQATGGAVNVQISHGGTLRVEAYTPTHSGGRK